ncbi:disease resistance protein RPM1-like [Durio zibethinus]|uniref:Disease resistance protein RPM1-like n=1 Tax=Durio zibethinus TaxID=66656 RepID=A0A6P5WLU2_DURZI|nr:disease resistance protein RPM1-like [Durio zibethinus]
MAEIAVSFLLEKLASFLQNEVELLRGIPEDLEYIKDELQSMKAVLRVADSVGESNQELKFWVRQVREVAYDTEDILDEYRLDVVNDHTQGIGAVLYNVWCFTKNLKAQHGIVSKIRGIKSRISNISARRPNYDNNGTNEQGPSSTAAVNPWLDRRGDALLLDSVDLVGIDEPKTQLINWLVEGNSGRKVVSVVGMGGSGKTTLVKQVYDNAKVKKHFAVHVWFTISHPLKIEELLRNMVRHLFDAIRRPVPQGVDDMDATLLKMVIKAFLQQRRYLIVLDDVWHINEWAVVDYALANNGRGSRVLLTTRNSEVASTSCIESEDKAFYVKPLSPDESWDLFCKKCFRRSPCPPELEKHSRRILEKCEGLPLAIVAISGVLATKRRTVAEWETVYRSLGAEIEDNSKLINFKEVLLLSFNDLPYHLKSCFLYLCLFPEYHLIEKMRLIRLWIAEGFVEVKEGKTQEEVAEDYLDELLNRSMIQVAGTANDGRVRTCRIHDLLREIIISNARDQNFVAVVKDQNATWSDKVRRLAMHNTFPNAQHDKNVSHLRSLFMFGMGDPLSCSSTNTLLIPNTCRLLKVLDLRGVPIQTFPEEVINLRLLRYLSLRDTKIKTIPSSIGKLQDLETLDLKHSQVAELPVEILKLRRLRHLLVYRYEFTSYSRFHSKYGFKALSGIGTLQSLQKLCFMEVNHDNALIIELGKLTQLRRLGIANLRKEDGRLLCSSIEKLINLRALSIVSSVKDGFIDLQCLSSPPEFLQRLYLYGRLEKLPEWIPSLESLAVVYLKWSRLPDDAFESLQNLPNLIHLELLQATEGDTLSFKAGGFKKLEHLGIDKFEGLKYIEVEKGAMPCLENLSIQRCKLLERVPLGIEYLTKLKVLEFFDMPEELIMNLRPDAQGGDYSKVANIPEVYYTYWRNGEWEVYPIDSGEKEHNTNNINEKLQNRFK